MQTASQASLKPPRLAPPVRTDLQEHMTRTYFTVRLGMVLIAFLLPPVLVIGGLIVERPPLVRPSMSDYYNGPALLGDVFVGALVAVGALLLLYKGFSAAEDRALNLAGAFAIGTALFPTGNPAHGWFAVLLFLCIAWVCWFRASDTKELISNARDREWYERTYKLLALLMGLLPVAAAVLAIMLFRSRVVLVVEWVAIWVFGAYWAVKSWEFHRTHADQRAAMGRLEIRSTLPSGGRVKQALGGALGRKSVVEVA